MTVSRSFPLPVSKWQVAHDLKAFGLVVSYCETNSSIVAQFLCAQIYRSSKRTGDCDRDFTDTARMKRAVVDRLQGFPLVSGHNLCEHGNSQFVAWSQVRVKGHAITDLFSRRAWRHPLRGPRAVATMALWQILYHFGNCSSSPTFSEAVITIATRKCLCSNYRPEYGTLSWLPGDCRSKRNSERLTCIWQKKKKKITPFSRNHQGTHERGLSTHKQQPREILAYFLQFFEWYKRVSHEIIEGWHICPTFSSHSFDLPQKVE